MKVNGSGPLAGPQARRLERRGGQTGGGFRLGAAEETQQAQKSQAAQPAQQVTALLALQEVPDAARGPSRGIRRGLDLLDQLDRLRIELLSGRVSPVRLERIAHVLRSQRERIADPVLADVLAEVEVRAAVELAKFERMRATGT